MASNKGFQKHNIDKMLKKQGVTDFDTESHVDAELSMSENIDNLEDQLGMSLRDSGPRSGKAARERQGNADLKSAKMRHEARSEHAQKIDEVKEAETVFEPPLTDEEWETWSEDPDDTDIMGVDLF